MREIERLYARRSLANFARGAWRIIEPATPLKWGWAPEAICDHLEAVSSGQIKRLLIMVPPGTMKSTLTSVVWPAWQWGPKGLPSMRMISTSHKQDLAVRDSTKCRRLIESRWYQELWPIKLTSDQNQKTKFENDQTGFREAAAFGSLTGSRCDRLIIDDPHSVDDANSRVKLTADVVTFREAVPTRLNNDESAIIIIMQRLAVGDIADVARELGYDCLQIPMRYEATRSKWAVGKGDPRTRDGELMFPERFSETAVRELEKALGSHAAAAQLQQRPNPRGGRVIKSEWFPIYSVLPPLQFRVVYADTAQKTAERNDYSVFECWGKGADGRIYLIDMIRGKWEAPELERRAIAFWRKHVALAQDGIGALRKMKVEDKASGTGLIQSLKSQAHIPIVGIERTKDKYTRVLDVLGQIEAGRVVLPKDAPFLSDLLTECESFSADDTHPHDDQIDPMIDAINDMLPARDPMSIWRAVA
jgi:phage uncharacterized protein (putative large terminase), C-terminal domain